MNEKIVWIRISRIKGLVGFKRNSGSSDND
jgi:hypothetical protein